MTQKPKKRKDGKFTERFLGLFPAYRELEKIIRRKDDALNLSAAVIRSNKDEIANLQKKIVSDSNLIESLNRHIEALEGRDNERLKRIDELERVCEENLKYINELREQMNSLLAIPGNKEVQA